ncbi:MAG: Gfo/Idh/MocA family oxidoreductase [Armatimonadetes bacterium]|nr:Gfo/Idh/MocA family oxidoreductase [Armatimonadota bacterium]
MFKCAFLGCGPRAKGHARAYAHVERGRIVAISDLNEERLNAFGDEFGVATRYRDVHEMLEREQPDLLHVVSLPGLRVELLGIAVEHRVPAVIVEKPIALFGEDWRKIRDLGEAGPTRICVNTQLHFHGPNLELKKLVAGGGIGEIRFIDASARSTPLDQGVHVLELADSYNGWAGFSRVFGQVSGGRELSGGQPSPERCSALIEFANEVRCQLNCGDVAPFATPHRESRYYHKRCATYGTAGFVHWTMEGWEKRTVSGGYESGSHSYGVEDELAQARLTEAVFDWLLDDTPHPTRLERSLAEFGAILGMYQSALASVPVDLPWEPVEGLGEGLKARLG